MEENEEKNENELIVSKEPITGDNILYILPSNLSSIKFIQSNTFDYATIQDCSVSSITSLSLSHIFRAMKPGGRCEIIISQPIAVMQSLDSKQIEAHAEHVGFDNITIEDTNYIDEKTGKEFPTLSVVCYKPYKRKEDLNINVIKETKKITTTSYSKSYYSKKK